LDISSPRAASSGLLHESLLIGLRDSGATNFCAAIFCAVLALASKIRAPSIQVSESWQARI
jgi:hypothetical protein